MHFSILASKQQQIINQLVKLGHISPSHVETQRVPLILFIPIYFKITFIFLYLYYLYWPSRNLIEIVGLVRIVIVSFVSYIYTKKTQLQYHLILSCVFSTLYKEVSPLKRLAINLCYSLLRHLLLYYGNFLLFFCFFGNLFHTKLFLTKGITSEAMLSIIEYSRPTYLIQ